MPTPLRVAAEVIVDAEPEVMRSSLRRFARLLRKPAPQD
jgi:hypothetical protein